MPSVELEPTLPMGLCPHRIFPGAHSLSVETRGQTEPAALTSRLPVLCGLVSIPLPHAGLSSGHVPALRTGMVSRQLHSGPGTLGTPSLLFTAWWSRPRDRKLDTSVCCVTTAQSLPSGPYL